MENDEEDWCRCSNLPYNWRDANCGAEERVEVQALRFGELWGGVPSLADRQARASRRFKALRVVRFGELWGGVPPFAHEQAPPRTRRRQVHLVRIEVHRRRLPPQPYRQACEVDVASRVRVGLWFRTEREGRLLRLFPQILPEFVEVGVRSMVRIVCNAVAFFHCRDCERIG